MATSRTQRDCCERSKPLANRGRFSLMSEGPLVRRSSRPSDRTRTPAGVENCRPVLSVGARTFERYARPTANVFDPLRPFDLSVTLTPPCKVQRPFVQCYVSAAVTWLVECIFQRLIQPNSADSVNVRPSHERCDGHRSRRSRSTPRSVYCRKRLSSKQRSLRPYRAIFPTTSAGTSNRGADCVDLNIGKIKHCSSTQQERGTWTKKHRCHFGPPP